MATVNQFDRARDARRARLFRPLAGNTALARVVGGYVLFIVTQYSVWVAMLVYAYRHGGAAVAGLVAVGIAYISGWMKLALS